MKSKIALLILCFSFILFVSACGKNESTNANSTPDSQNYNNIGTEGSAEGDIVKIIEEEAFDYKNYDWKALISEAAFDKNTKIGSTALKVLEIEITNVTSENISLKIKAPYIKDELLTWFNESYSGTDSLESEIIKLLNNEKKEYSFTLNYFATANKEPHIDYTSDFSNAVTCGILEFTAVLEAEFIEELEGGVYD